MVLDQADGNALEIGGERRGGEIAGHEQMKASVLADAAAAVSEIIGDELVNVPVAGPLSAWASLAL